MTFQLRELTFHLQINHQSSIFFSKNVLSTKCPLSISRNDYESNICFANRVFHTATEQPISIEIIFTRILSVSKRRTPKRILSSLKETVVIVFFFFSRIFETLRIRKEIISITMGCSVTVYNPLPVSRIDYELTLFILSYFENISRSQKNLGSLNTIKPHFFTCNMKSYGHEWSRINPFLCPGWSKVEKKLKKKMAFESDIWSN